MRGAIQTGPGEPPVLDNIAPPTAGKDEVMVHVRTAGLGGWDIAGAYQAELKYPCVLRGEGVGFTDQGQRVYFGEHSRQPYGAFCERTVVPREEVWEVPEDISDEMAIAMGIAGSGAYDPLVRVARIAKGDAVLVTGSTGTLGQFALQFARHLGAGHVVAAGRDQVSLERLVRRGIADAYAVVGGDNDVSQLKAASGGDGYDVVLDAVYGPIFGSVLKATKPGCRIVTVGGMAGGKTVVDAKDLIYRWHVAWSTGRLPAGERQAIWLELLDLGRQGIDVEYARYSFDRTPEAYEAQRSSAHAKVVVAIEGLMPG